MGATFEQQQILKVVGESTIEQSYTTTIKPDTTKPSLTALCPTTFKPEKQRNIVHMPSLPPTRPAPGAMYVSTSVDGSEIWQHVCHRVRLHFTDAASGKDVDDLVPWVHASMHALIVPPAHAAAPPHLVHKHGLPEALDKALFADDKQAGLDPCNVDVQDASAEAKDGATSSMGSRIVMYIRFQEAGLQNLYVQV
jgi:hypothetical protein